MDEFSEIIALRNQGICQRKIALKMGRSEKTIRKYLKAGKVPEYTKNPNRVDTFSAYAEVAQELVNKYPDVTARRLYEELQRKGYKGSYRTLTRETMEMRRQAKLRPVYFKRKHFPGKYMEGDFTELDNVPIGGRPTKVHIWATVLTYSNFLWATPFNGQTFECFAEGSINAFKAFGGMAESYRLDNLKPVVFKILKEGRILTKRFRELQDHYNFKVEFCNPASGWEKGDIESAVGHLKRRIREEIALGNLKFKDLNSFKLFLWNLCERLNNRPDVHEKFLSESLSAMPKGEFSPFRPYMVKINKYSMFKWDGSNHYYSAPSKYVGLTLEARVSANDVSLYWQGTCVATHGRVFGREEKTVIDITHIISALCEKPGVADDWEFKDSLFTHPIWKKYYDCLVEQNSDTALKEHINSLALITEYGHDNIVAAMEIIMESEEYVGKKKILDLLTNESFNPLEIKPMRRNLLDYDNFLSKSEVVL